jgi:hypothetical protein
MIRPRFAALRQARLEDLQMDGGKHIFWPVTEKPVETKE